MINQLNSIEILKGIRFDDCFIDIGHNLARNIPDTGIQQKFYLKGARVNSLFIWYCIHKLVGCVKRPVS